MNISAQEISKAAAFAIGGIPVSGRALLAPLSGVTDIGMRRVAEATGASLVVSEMVASDEYINGKSEARLRAEGRGLSTHVVQIAGCDPAWMAEAARLVEAAGADIIDINMGCPSKRVNGRLSGSALMRDLDHATGLIEATVGAVKCPVTVKMRLGWDDRSYNAPELARRAADLGARMVTVHGRTRQQFYKGKAKWEAIRPVRDAISIPLVANGDCEGVEDARAMMAATGADAVMIGRAAVGRPWLVGEVADALAGRPVRILTAAEKAEHAARHLDTLLQSMRPEAGLRHARKHLAAYADHALAGLSASERDGYASDRLKLVTSMDAAEVHDLLQRLMLSASGHERFDNSTEAA